MNLGLLDRFRGWLAHRDFSSACHGFSKLAAKGIGTNALHSDGHGVGYYTSVPEHALQLEELVKTMVTFEDEDDI